MTAMTPLFFFQQIPSFTHAVGNEGPGPGLDHALQLAGYALIVFYDEHAAWDDGTPL